MVLQALCHFLHYYYCSCRMGIGPNLKYFPIYSPARYSAVEVQTKSFRVIIPTAFLCHLILGPKKKLVLRSWDLHQPQFRWVQSCFPQVCLTCLKLAKGIETMVYLPLQIIPKEMDCLMVFLNCYLPCQCCWRQIMDYPQTLSCFFICPRKLKAWVIHCCCSVRACYQMHSTQAQSPSMLVKSCQCQIIQEWTQVESYLE